MGIDEAGRGPVLGDLFIGGVVFEENFLSKLENTEIDDSKKINPDKREILFDFIVNHCFSHAIERITSKTIDESIRNNITLNDLELRSMAKLIIDLEPNVVYIDALGRDLKKFKQNLLKWVIPRMDFVPSIIPSYKADEKFKIVGAASILAKVHRDRSVKSLKSQYGEIGSGYPSDEITISFLKDYIKMHHKPPEIARFSWQTCKTLMDEIVHQRKLDDYLKEES